MCMREALLAIGCGIAVYVGICAWFLPVPLPAPQQPDGGVPLQSCTRGSDCPAPQACVDGTCVLPARQPPARVPFGSSEAYARWPDSTLSQ